MLVIQSGRLTDLNAPVALATVNFPEQQMAHHRSKFIFLLHYVLQFFQNSDSFVAFSRVSEFVLVFKAERTALAPVFASVFESNEEVGLKLAINGAKHSFLCRVVFSNHGRFCNLRLKAPDAPLNFNPMLLSRKHFPNEGTTHSVLTVFLVCFSIRECLPSVPTVFKSRETYLHVDVGVRVLIVEEVVV